MVNRDNPKEKWDAPSFTMKAEDFRISFGVYNDSHAGQPVTIKKQMHSYFSKLTTSDRGYNEFMNAIHDVPSMVLLKQLNI